MIMPTQVAKWKPDRGSSPTISTNHGQSAFHVDSEIQVLEKRRLPRIPEIHFFEAHNLASHSLWSWKPVPNTVSNQHRHLHIGQILAHLIDEHRAKSSEAIVQGHKGKTCRSFPSLLLIPPNLW